MKFNVGTTVVILAAVTLLGAGYLTFGVLMLVLHATPEQFRTGFFSRGAPS